MLHVSVVNAKPRLKMRWKLDFFSLFSWRPVRFCRSKFLINFVFSSSVIFHLSIWFDGAFVNFEFCSTAPGKDSGSCCVAVSGRFMIVSVFSLFSGFSSFDLWCPTDTVAFWWIFVFWRLAQFFSFSFFSNAIFNFIKGPLFRLWQLLFRPRIQKSGNFVFFPFTFVALSA